MRRLHFVTAAMLVLVLGHALAVQARNSKGTSGRDRIE